MALTATDISVQFSGVKAVDQVSFSFERGEILGLLGPNGAGKTTMVNVLSGFQRPTRGQVTLEDQRVSGTASADMARLGVVRTFQAVRLFQGLTVSENVEAALTSRNFGRAAARRKAREILDYMEISGRTSVTAGALNYGDERRVGIARALAQEPRYLLLDEPAAGMNIAEAEALSDLIRTICSDFGCGVLLIEHNMSLVSRTCGRLHVMASGRSIAAGEPEAVFADPIFRSAYLGIEEEA